MIELKMGLLLNQIDILEIKIRRRNNMKTLTEIEVLLREKAKENKNAIQEYAKKIEDAEQELEQANAKLLLAETEVDVDKYNEAKNSIWSAEHAKELYLKQKNKLVQEQLVDRSEYNQLLSKITQVANETHEEQNNRAAVLIAELRKISEESSQTLQKANELMHMLQREVYKEPEGAIPLENGGTTWSSDKEYTNQETVHAFYNDKVKGSNLDKRAGYEPEQQKKRFWG